MNILPVSKIKINMNSCDQYLNKGYNNKVKNFALKFVVKWENRHINNYINIDCAICPNTTCIH